MNRRKSFWERVQETKQKIEADPSYERNNYARRMRGILTLAYGFAAIVVAHVITRHWEISEFVAFSVAGIAAITAANLHAENLSAKRFPTESLHRQDSPTENVRSALDSQRDAYVQRVGAVLMMLYGVVFVSLAITTTIYLHIPGSLSAFIGFVAAVIAGFVHAATLANKKFKRRQ